MPTRRLGPFLRESRDVLLTSWTARVRALSPARELARPVLVDHVPKIVLRIADALDAGEVGRVRLGGAPTQHALDRLAHGFDLEAVIKEYSVLRQCILEHWEATVSGAIDVAQLRELEAALDACVTESTVSYSRTRERMLKAVNRIAEAADGTSDLEPFLARIASATLDTTEAADTVAVFLREGDTLRMRAAVGVEEEVERGFSVRIGEGLAGEIAASGQPMVLRDACEDPRTQSSALREKGVHALYGVPLQYRGDVIGVAYMGSRSAYEFSDEDQLLFRSMASRATSVIVQTQLVADLERAVSDRDRLVALLSAEGVRLEQILNQIPTGVLIAEAPSGELSLLNERAQEILGRRLAPAERPADFDGWQPFHLDGRSYAREDLPRVRALRGERVVDEFKVRRPDGSWVVVRAHAAPVEDRGGAIRSAVVAFEDVSGQKRYEDMLRFLSEAGHALVRSIDYETTLERIARITVPAIADWFVVDMLRDGELASVVVAHSDPAKVNVAKAYRRRFPPDLAAPYGVAKVLREGAPELFQDIPDALLAAAAGGEEQLRIARELGMRSAMVVPLTVAGRTIGVVSLVSAESGRRFDHHDLEVAQGLADRAALAIENARLFREAERAIKLREDVLAVVSHDLRNPLASVAMSAGLLLRGEADARRRKPLEIILRATGRMERMIGDLLDMASVQAGRLAVVREVHELAPILVEAADLARPLATAKDQDLAAELHIGEARVRVDRERALQLLANLLGNAKKFCPRGGRITLRARIVGGEVECSVADTGPGIPEHAVGRVFDPYFSVERETKAGVGLGLFISKAIVEAHGGRIWVENHPGAGATFCFTLPLAT